MSTAWWRKPLRIYQPNLRLTDGAVPGVQLVGEAVELSANAMVVNAGGAFAFYPSELDCQEIAPTLTGDLFGDVAAEARAKGIRVIARIEISVKSQAVHERHPEWFYVDGDRAPLIARGHYATCINGPGFREQLRATINELWQRYRIDGVFFNGYGLRDSDASGYRGPCRCPGCVDAYGRFSGSDLPSPDELRTNAGRETYDRFKIATSAAFLGEIKAFVRERNPDCVVFQGTSYTSTTDTPGHSPAEMLAALGDTPDLVRCEYQQAPYHDPATWTHWVGEQGKIGMSAGRRTDVILDYPMSGRYRHACHSPSWVGLVLARTLAAAAVPHVHFIGPMGVQNDRSGIEPVRRLMRFARENDWVWDAPRSASRVAIYLPHLSARHDPDGAFLTAYRGWYRALTRRHVPFDVVPSPEYGTGDLPAKLAGHDAVIVPNASRLTEFDERALDSYVGEGGALLATLSTSLFDENGVRRSEFGLRCLRAATPLELSRADMNAYLRFDANLLPGFPPDIDVVPVHGDILEVRVSGGASAAMSMTGPEPDCIPEDAYIREWTEQPGLVSSAYGDGRVAYLPWAPDRMYHEARQPALEALLMGALTGLSPDAVGLVEIDAPPFVEIAAYRQAGRLLLHLVNAGGCWDGHFDDPVPVQGIRVCVDGVFRRATALGGSVGLEIVRENGRSVLEVPELALYEVVSLEADRA